MAGPILTFLDNLQDRQPVRNAVRGVFGLPQKRSTVIDPMEEMAARDAERGGDISNPNPMTRPAPRIASNATGGPGVAAGLPAPPQAIDETQPYQGMGMIKGMTTPPSAALRERRQMAARPMAQAGGSNSLSQSISLIHQMPDLPPADRAQMLSDLMYRSATEATDNDRRETLMRIGDTYMKQHMVLTGMAAGEKSLKEARDTANKISRRAKRSADDAGAREERMNERTITGQQEINAQVYGFQKADTSRATSSRDYLSPLLEDPTMPISAFAAQARRPPIRRCLMPKNAVHSIADSTCGSRNSPRLTTTQSRSCTQATRCLVTLRSITAACSRKTQTPMTICSTHWPGRYRRRWGRI